MSEEIAVEIHGNGDPVVMIHGLGGTSNVFGPQADVLSKYFRVIRPDLPGSGRSAATGAATIESLVEVVISVMDRNGARPAHLVGHSMGTIICQHIAVKYPDAVKSLALIGPLAAPPEAARPNITARAEKARAEGMAGIADTIVQGGTSAYTKAAKPEVAAFVREILMRQDPEGYALSCEALAKAQPAAVESVNMPTLLLTGTEDGTSPPAAVRALAKRIPGSQTLVFSACGHWTPVEAARQVTEALVNFYFDSNRQFV